jgi:hypothetical protein
MRIRLYRSAHRFGMKGAIQQLPIRLFHGSDKPSATFLEAISDYAAPSYVSILIGLDVSGGQRALSSRRRGPTSHFEHLPVNGALKPQSFE